ncbi:restriction endonuclease subunit S [Pseudomonas sp. SK3(2021)]|uniref:restriction endonuclease subunit S n=1 Tax=Pseudomonas sp. SK3(2021) TaxID=2841064 RepID=UPI00192C3351|nr:restriction endonuclease subunit S [Pseudomonas sp. SK3(2021)]QQZ44313.1 restriction endonuclease subunit S [Pseudomonas sp. SK3(2021)]
MSSKTAELRNIPASWQSGELRSFLDLITYGFTNPMPDAEVGPWKITAKDVIDGRINYATARKTTAEAFIEKLTDKSRPKVGDVLLTKDGSIGRVAVVDCDGVCINQSVALLRPNRRINSHFLKYLLLSPHYQRVMEGDSDGSTIKHIYITRVDKMQVLVPPLLEQESIFQLVGSIDDRITLLRETNSTLEAIAQTLFRSWFVDFDPVHAKAVGLEPEGMDAATAALFPSSFEESEQGLVPAGWELQKVQDLMELSYGKALKATDRIDGPVPVYGSGGVTGSHNKSLVNGPSVIVGRKGTVGSLYWEDRPFFPIDTVFYVRTDKPLTYCYCLLKTLGLESMNTDGAVPGLNRNNVYRLPVVVATKSILESFDKIVFSLRKKMFSNNQLAQTLTQLRDTLLPRLISGQLRLPEATAATEKILSEAI